VGLGRGKLIVAGALALAAIAPASSQAAVLDANCPGPTNAGFSGTEAQTFTAVHTGTLVSAEMFIAKSTGANFQMQIFNAGPSGPTGSALATVAIPDSAVANVPSPGPTSASAPIDGTFSPGVPVTAGQMYAVFVSRPGSSFIAKDRSGDPCPGNEFAQQPDGSWLMANPNYDFPFSTQVELPAPSNQFTIKSQVGRTVTVTVPGPGTLTLGQAALPPGVATAIRGFEVLRGSSATATGAGDFTLPILLNKSGKRQLRQRGKLSRTGEVTFTPTGGSAKAVDFPIKLKNRRRHHK
jgi:hypothetical protein